MDNYYVPKLLKIINRLELIFGGAGYCIFAFMMSSSDVSKYLGTRVHFAMSMLMIAESLVAITKTITYIACMTKGYKTSILSLIVYIVYAIATVIIALMYTIYLITRMM